MDNNPPPAADHNGNDQHNDEQVPHHVPRQAPLIGAYDAPNVNGHQTGIRAPPVENNHFEIKASLINMVQGSKFHGLAMEDPLDHLDQFDRFCGTVKINDISEDAFKLRLFPFSLGDKAHIWEKNLPHNTITSWDQCKKASLSKFFSTTRTSRLRNEISSFAQKGNESFCEAWERFKGYISQCSHHGFSMESQLSTLYRGVLPKYRMLLDTASNVNFLGQNAAQGMLLVENLAQSDGNYGEDYDRTPRDYTDMNEKQRKEIKALNDKMDKMILANQKIVHFVTESDVYQGYQEGMDACVEGQEEVNYVGGQGYNKFNPNYHNHPNLSYRSTNVDNPQDQSYPPQKPPGFPSQPNYHPKPQGNYHPKPQGNYQAKSQSYSQPQQQMNTPHPQGQVDDTTALLRQILEGQGRGAIELATQMKAMHHKVENVYGELNAKIERLQTQVQGQASSSSTRQMGSLAGKPEPNPKEIINAIMLRSGKQLPTNELNRDFETKGGEVVVEIEDDDELVVKYLGKYKEADEVVVDKGKSKVVEEPKQDNTINEVFKKSKEIAKETLFVPPPYEPRLPFPGRFKKQQVDKYRAMFDAQMKDVAITMPIIDAFLLNPSYNKFLKDAVLEKKKALQGMVILTHECGAIIQNKVVAKKLEDPGSFTLPCTLGPLSFSHCLCDMGSSVSLMSLSVAKRLVSLTTRSA
ncbi:PREDICTED: uncharacterized protein LOC104728173 [Camelina sativa]|uniref:Uncharacterized protein LOC104728173 n=1 Tax=Camelina sativa TaxID=90675 RepID=A0ABM0USF1_CAMSA|nr:PREDICTED: uncharacterized protein LOC104728173 [Camelina sativa]